MTEAAAVSYESMPFPDPVPHAKRAIDRWRKWITAQTSPQWPVDEHGERQGIVLRKGAAFSGTADSFRMTVHANANQRGYRAEVAIIEGGQAVAVRFYRREPK